MKTRVLLFTALCGALLMVAGCKNKEPQGAKIESISFKQSLYEIAENYLDLNLKKELVVTPEGIKDSAKIKWVLDNDEIAEMSGSFLIPKGPGDVKVTATIQGMSASCKVSISEIPIEDIVLSDMTIIMGETQKVDAKTTPEGISLSRFSWSSDKTSVATVNEDGEVTAVTEGTAYITAKYGSEISKKCKVTVNAIRVTSVTLSAASYKFRAVNETYQLNATVKPDNASFPKVTWKSSNTSVATVSSTGLVTCKSGGSAFITATADNVTSEQCTVFMVETGTVSDCQGHTYKTVKIGNQWWMAENLKCNKYDTRSGKSGTTISTFSTSIYDDTWNASYYTDATRTTNYATYEYMENLSSGQINKLGYAYTWTAATGETFAYNKTFTGNKQGICPNGWHLPKTEEWLTLDTTIGDDARLINSTSGWWRANCNGSDIYGFNCLPAGYCSGSNYDVSEYGYGKGKVSAVGREVYFQTATCTKYGVQWANVDVMYQAEFPHIYFGDTHSNIDAAFVRCVKD